MKLRFIIVMFCVIICCSCHQKSDNLFSQVDIEDIETITIRSQMTEEYPQQIVTDSEEEIQEIMNQLLMVDYNPLIDDTDENGWGFWIIIKMGESEDINIMLLNDNVTVGESKFESSGDLIGKIKELFDNSKAEKTKIR